MTRGRYAARFGLLAAIAGTLGVVQRVAAEDCAATTSEGVANNAVFRIVDVKTPRPYKTLGTAFLVHKAGYFLTAYHVAAGADDTEIDARLTNETMSVLFEFVAMPAAGDRYDPQKGDWILLKATEGDNGARYDLEVLPFALRYDDRADQKPATLKGYSTEPDQPGARLTTNVVEKYEKNGEDWTLNDSYMKPNYSGSPILENVAGRYRVVGIVSYRDVDKLSDAGTGFRSVLGDRSATGEEIADAVARVERTRSQFLGVSVRKPLSGIADETKRTVLNREYWRPGMTRTQIAEPAAPVMIPQKMASSDYVLKVVGDGFTDENYAAVRNNENGYTWFDFLYLAFEYAQVKEGIWTSDSQRAVRWEAFLQGMMLRLCVGEIFPPILRTPPAAPADPRARVSAAKSEEALIALTAGGAPAPVSGAQDTRLAKLNDRLASAAADEFEAALLDDAATGEDVETLARRAVLALAPLALGQGLDAMSGRDALALSLATSVMLASTPHTAHAEAVRRLPARFAIAAFDADDDSEHDWRDYAAAALAADIGGLPAAAGHARRKMLAATPDAAARAQSQSPFNPILLRAHPSRHAPPALGDADRAALLRLVEARPLGGAAPNAPQDQ